jgi:hypothetical protein
METEKHTLNQREDSPNTPRDRSLEPIREFSDEEILDLQNNIYKLYVILKIIKNTNKFSMRDLKVLSTFGHHYIFSPNCSYDDEDFTRFCNIYDCWVEDTFRHLRKLPDKERNTEEERFYKEDRRLILESIKNISKRYFKLKFLMRLDVEGTIMYGRYLGQKILITKDEEYDTFYNIYLWYEDEPKDKEELFAKTKTEVQKFFRHNKVVVKWEKEKKT